MAVLNECLFGRGHRACAGCGCALALKLATQVAGPDTIVAEATGCMEVVSTPYPETAWKLPWIHGNFENAASIASGISEALKMKGEKTKVLAVGGDGGTFDIGMRALSGAMERGHNFVYLCYDNEAYMNTGIQRSSATPLHAATTTSPYGKKVPGNLRPKKDLAHIVAAHGVGYVATASIAYPQDFQDKLERAFETEGAAFVHVHATCPVGWRMPSAKTVEVAKMAVKCGMFPLYEIVEGRHKLTMPLDKLEPVGDYLKTQGRFKKLTQSDVAEIQKMVNDYCGWLGELAEKGL